MHDEIPRVPPHALPRPHVRPSQSIMSEIDASRTQLQGAMDGFNEMTGTIRGYRKEQLELEKKIELLKLKRESETAE
jgi:hypothetical protein